MNQVDPSEQMEENPFEAPSKAPAENLSGMFVLIVAAAVLFGGLPYLYPANST